MPGVDCGGKPPAGTEGGNPEMAAFSFRLRRDNGRVLIGLALSNDDLDALRSGKPIPVPIAHHDTRLAGFDGVVVRADDVEQVANLLHLLPRE